VSSGSSTVPPVTRSAATVCGEPPLSGVLGDDIFNLALIPIVGTSKN
jgi:hypothetical protein